MDEGFKLAKKLQQCIIQYATAALTLPSPYLFTSSILLWTSTAVRKCVFGYKSCPAWHGSHH